MAEPPIKKSKTESEKSKAYQYKSNKRHFLEIGQRGFLATCNFREKDCVRECYNILRQYADDLYGPETKTDAKEQTTSPEKKDEEEETDIADDLQKEIDAVKTAADPGRSRRFQSVDTGTKNCVFIKTTLKDPVELGTKIIKDIAEKKIQKTKFLLRLTPIEVVCKADVGEITKAGGAIFDKYFLQGGKTFSVVLNKRYNNDIKRDDIIKALADLVIEKNVGNKVDLKNPELSVIVEIIKGKCCLSVVEGYLKYRKYNLVELATNKQGSPVAEKDEGDGEKEQVDKEEEEHEETEDDHESENDNGNEEGNGGNNEAEGEEAVETEETVENPPAEEEPQRPAQPPPPPPAREPLSKLKELLEGKNPYQADSTTNNTRDQ